jgi:hypothetical protein
MLMKTITITGEISENLSPEEIDFLLDALAQCDITEIKIDEE